MDLYQVHTIVDIARIRAAAQGNKPAYISIDRNSDRQTSITFSELDEKARIVAGYLNHHAMPGCRVALFFKPGLEYIATFMGCLYAGMVAVPISPPREDLSLFHGGPVLHDCQAAVALTSAENLPTLRLLLEGHPDFSKIHLACVSQIPHRYQEDWRPLSQQSDALAFLQYARGKEPRGIMITQGNLMENAAVIARAFETTSEDIGLNWLPLGHDMGLISTVFQSIYKGFTSILMPSMGFIRDPITWLEAISRYRATLSGGPDFAYELCVQLAKGNRIRQLDLSCWRVAFNGAQAIKPHTIRSFARAFARAGYKAETMLPCYGLPEATLFVSGGWFRQVPKILYLDKTQLAAGLACEPLDRNQFAVALVSNGSPRLDDRIEIVDKDSGLPLPEGRIGEIWISGPGVARGYWNQPDATQAVFHNHIPGQSGRFLRSGDLGFLWDGELYVIGPLPDPLVSTDRNRLPRKTDALFAGLTIR